MNFAYIVMFLVLLHYGCTLRPIDTSKLNFIIIFDIYNDLFICCSNY